ncbi:MAG: hypothetical protein AB1571_01110 [Nanoarchaeota archaeon]
MEKNYSLLLILYEKNKDIILESHFNEDIKQTEKTLEKLANDNDIKIIRHSILANLDINDVFYTLLKKGMGHKMNTKKDFCSFSYNIEECNKVYDNYQELISLDYKKAEHNQH